MRFAILGAAGVALAGVTAPAMSATVDAVDIISNFTVTALGDLDFRGNTNGGVVVGGNFTAPNGGNISPDGGGGTVDGQRGVVIIGGDASAPGNRVNVNINQDQNGGVVVGGTNNDAFNINSATPADRIVGTGQIDPVAIRAAFDGLSAELAALSTTSGASLDAADRNQIRLTSGAGVDGVATLNVANGDFLSGGTLTGFERDDNTTFIVNVGGESASIGANFNQVDTSTIFNFFEATSLNIGATFGFGILAPLADITQINAETRGFVVGNNIDQRSTIRNVFEGDLAGLAGPAVAPVPLPAAGFLLIAGLGGLGLMRRLRGRATA